MSDGAGHIRLEHAGRLAYLVIDRPAKRNAMDAEMVAELGRLCHAIDTDPTIGVAILSGAGDAFSAGGDIAAWSALSPRDFAWRWVRDGHAAFDALARLRVPLIAVLDGPVLGGGLELAACADYRIAEAHIRVGQPETGLGIIPGWSGTQRAVRRFGAQAVRRMALMGETFDAQTARALGIVDQVVASGTGPDAAQDVARGILARGAEATGLTKLAINAAEGEERERPLDILTGHWAAGSDELAEGLAAFREKRPPNFGKDDT